ncbi:hypothetical protein B0H16DRAFT_1545520 [Mycena metata]|uniref:Uncharacterized protein n=1 Tax=Mycena metata TaxID=1033252 RepID=A0AAD7IZI8_9AGAR|nr:hypothetical protein B0H16DRAFT_1545520 [Mycena metata]
MPEKKVPEKKKVKIVTIGDKGKPKPAAYDPQQDLELIAAENNVPLELVGEVYAKMKTVIKTMHMVETISAHMGPSASDHESDSELTNSESDEDEERVIVKVEKKAAVKKRQHEEEEDSGESSEQVKPRRKQGDPPYQVAFPNSSDILPVTSTAAPASQYIFGILNIPNPDRIL